MVPSTDGSVEEHVQCGYYRSFLGAFTIGYFIVYATMLWVWMILYAFPVYGWWRMFGWTPEIQNDIVGAWMILFFISFFIWSVLALGRVKWSKFVLMPCPLDSAEIVMIENLGGDGSKFKPGDSKSSIGSTVNKESSQDSIEAGEYPVDEAGGLTQTKKKKGFRWDHILIWLKQHLLGTAPRVQVTTSGAPKSKAYFEKIGKSPTEIVRSFDFMCLRYVWDTQTKSFNQLKLPEDSPKDCIARVKEGGLTEEDAASAAQLAGENAIRVEVESFIVSLIGEFASALYLLNAMTVFVWFIFSGWNLAAVWLISISFSGVVRVILQRSVKNKVRSMAKMDTDVQLYRGGKWSTYKSNEVVPGDVIVLQEGEVACCDAIVTQGNVVMNESMLTGEPMPIQKLSISPGEAKIDKKCVVFGGTEILQSMGGPAHADGRCIAVVKDVGGSTAKGEVVRMVLYPCPMNFVFRKHLDLLYSLLVVWAFFIFVFVIALGDGGYWAWSVINAIASLAYAVNPNMDMTISWAESLTVRRLAKENISVLDPSRLVVAGKVHCAVFDKTGTITEGTVNIKYVTIVSEGKFQGSEEIGANDWQKNLTQWKDSFYLYHIMGLCHMVTQLKDGRVVGNSVEVSMWTASGWTLPDDNNNTAHPNRDKKDEEKVADRDNTNHRINMPASGAARAIQRRMSEDIQTNADGVSPARMLRTLRFDHARMTSGCVVHMVNKEGAHQTVLLLKGSFDRLKDLCTKDSVPADYNQYTDAAAGNQEYILAAAIRVLPPGFDVDGASRDELEKDLQLVGILHFTNELRPTSAEALRELREAGIRCCMCTGDAVATAIAVARKVGMLTITEGAPPPRAVIDVKGPREVGPQHRPKKVDPQKHDQTQNTFYKRTVVGGGGWGGGGSQASATNFSTPESITSRGDVKRAGKGPHQKAYANPEFDFAPRTFRDEQGAWNPAMHVIYGEVIDGVINWSHVDTDAVYSTKEVLQLVHHCPEVVELVLSGECFMMIREGPSNENVPPLSPILPSIRITSRVTPAGKVAFVNSIASEKGVVVGMCGDGGNDCGALREAHIGLAMSSAEASLVAPFATTTESLKSFCDIVAHGRATLRTNVATTMWFTVMGIVISLTRSIYVIEQNYFPSEFSIIYQMFGLSIIVALAICCAEPLGKLDAARPSATIFRMPFMIRLGWYLLLYALLMTGAMVVAVNRDWYSDCDLIRQLGLDMLNYTTRTTNFRSEIFTISVTWVILVLAVAVSFGGSFRRAPIWNFVLIVTVGGSAALYLIMLWSGPSGLSCVFAYNCDTPTSLDTTPIIIKQISVGNLGGCYFGSQICKQKDVIEAAGMDWQVPYPENNCTFDVQANQPFNVDNTYLGSQPPQASSLLQSSDEYPEWERSGMNSIYERYSNTPRIYDYDAPSKEEYISLMARPSHHQHQHHRQLEAKAGFTVEHSENGAYFEQPTYIYYDNFLRKIFLRIVQFFSKPTKRFTFLF